MSEGRGEDTELPVAVSLDRLIIHIDAFKWVKANISETSLFAYCGMWTGAADADKKRTVRISADVSKLG